jgi:2-oxoglutarate dehydrogenase E2 component (dihydrolipoamide succinyltransferase)
LNPGYIKVEVPRSSANDDTVILIEWLKADGEHVKKNEDICIIESSKATFELVADASGFLYHTRNQGDEVAVGQMIAVIAQQQQRPEILNEQSKHLGNIKVTAKARKLIKEHNLNIAEFAGIDIVKEKDVQRYLAKHGSSEQESILPGRLVPLSHVERRTAKVISESAMQTPHSYLTTHIDAQAADEVLAEIARKEDILVSLSDQLVTCVARTVEKHKKVNASWRENAIYYHDRINVGFALNQSDGSLVVPVIRDANKMDLMNEGEPR